MHVITEGYRAFQVQNALKSGIVHITTETKNEAKQQAKHMSGDRGTQKVVSQTIRCSTPVVAATVSTFSQVGYKAAVASMHKYNVRHGAQIESALDRVGAFTVGSTKFDGATRKTEAGIERSVIDLRKESAERCKSIAIQLEQYNIKREFASPEQIKSIDKSISELTKNLADEKETLINLSKSEWISQDQVSTSIDMNVSLKRYTDYAQKRMEKMVGKNISSKIDRPTVILDKKGVELTDGVLHTHHIDHQAREIYQSMKLYKHAFNKNIKSLYDTPELRHSVCYKNLMKQHRSDKKVVNGMKRRAKWADKFDRSRYKGFKKAPRRLSRIVTSTLNQTEAGRGYMILQACTNAGRIVTKSAYKATELSTQKIIFEYKIKKEIKQLEKSGIKGSRFAIRKTAKETLASKGITGKVQRDFFKSKIRNQAMKSYDKLLVKKVDKIKTGKITDKSLKELAKLEHKMALSSAFKEGGLKGTGKEVLKGLHKSYKEQVKASAKAGKILKKVKPKWKPNLVRIGQNAYKAATEAAKRVSTKVAETIAKALGMTGKALVHGFGLVVAAISPVLPFVIIGGLLLILLISSTGLTASIPSQGYPGSYELTGHSVGSAFNFKTKMKILTDCHDKFVKDIQEDNDIKNYYDAVQIVYDDGVQENYQELLCAYYTEVHDDEASITEGDDQVAEVILTELYEQTHKWYVEDIEVENGVTDNVKYGQVHVGIQRDDYLVYQLLKGIMGGRQELNEDLLVCPSGTVDNTIWLEVVKEVKSLVATACANVGYSQEKYCSIELNGKTYSVRRDCSGYVSACLSVYTGKTFSYSSENFTKHKQGSIPGFTKYVFSGWNNLQAGDIIAYCGHVEIFAGLDEHGAPLVYSNGSTEGLHSALPRSESKSHNYAVVWRPNSTGSETDDGTTSDETTGGGTTDSSHNLIKSLENVTSGQVKKLTESLKDADIEDEYVTAIMLDSNTKDREYDENGNEIGYEKALIKTAKKLVDDEAFTAGAFDFWDFDRSNGWHSLLGSDDKTQVSSLDYLRVVYANHGLMIPSSIYGLRSVYSKIEYKDLKIGDIVLYQNAIAENPKDIEAEINDMDVNSLKNADKVGLAFGKYDMLTPLIYIGDDTFIGYCLDITVGIDGENNVNRQKYTTQTGADAKVRMYTLDDLELSRMECHEVNGILKDSVYGHNNMFEGWTDANIEQYINYNKSFGSKSYAFNEEGEVEELDYFDEYMKVVTPDENGNRGDVFSSKQEDLYFATDEYINTVLENFVDATSDAYDDYGLYPSVIIALAMTKSNTFSCEQAVVLNNYFNTQAKGESYASGRNAVVKYDFDLHETNSSRITYNVYSSINNCVDEYLSNLHKKLDSAHKNTEYSTAEALLSDLLAQGVITSAEEEQMKNYIDNYGLKAYDPVTTDDLIFIDVSKCKSVSSLSSYDPYKTLFASGDVTEYGWESIYHVSTCILASDKKAVITVPDNPLTEAGYTSVGYHPCPLCLSGSSYMP